ncbi:unnamed protein product [Didymodactylos carnosus]|uniref:Uncharacterized protein n=1 Tax=Didymodactylos carnosus TaxID=1234261 RepID=A0A813S8T5_9BILA|nr:unnamed protein product [Didymodactylos carnosus]CAF3575985.1 unnamed protein product [Didymodactylos carnosus]
MTNNTWDYIMYQYHFENNNNNNNNNELNNFRNEQCRFSFMFIVFSFIALTITIWMFTLANTNMSKKYLAPYLIIGCLSLLLFCIFFWGTLVYLFKVLKTSNNEQQQQKQTKKVLNVHFSDSQSIFQSRTINNDNHKTFDDKILHFMTHSDV